MEKRALFFDLLELIRFYGKTMETEDTSFTILVMKNGDVVEINNNHDYLYKHHINGDIKYLNESSNYSEIPSNIFDIQLLMSEISIEHGIM